ncbi:MAG: IS4 family transposase [Terriglobia bacterium]
MKRVCSIFSQILYLFPRLEFEQMVRKHRAERHARGFTCWGQFIAMLFCQLGQAHSLREICGGLAACEGKLRHLGLREAPKRSTLGYANEHRPWQLFESVFQRLYSRCQELSQGSAPRRRFRFRNRLLLMDATMIELCASLFDWAAYQRTKGAVKLHLLLDHQGYLPQFAVLTTGKVQEIEVARTLRFQPGTIVVMDRGYVDYAWYEQLTQQGVFFVTRLRRDAHYQVIEDRPLPQRGNILSDQIIQLGSHWYLQPSDLRRIEVEMPDEKGPLVLLTNHLHFGPTTVSRIYRERWKIEVFFRDLKQNLRIKTFVGTSANALKIQIWTALIAILLLKYLQLRASYGWSLSNLVALLRQQLFVYRDLFTWLDQPFEPPPALQSLPVQLSLLGA